MSNAPDSAAAARLSRAAQLNALRAAFPDYSFRVIRWDGRKPRYEALSQSGCDPWCLISDDAREIWGALETANATA